MSIPAKMLTRIATFAKDKKCCERRESAAKDVKMLRKTIYVANVAKDAKVAKHPEPEGREDLGGG
jgi:hypothetical protein